MSYEILKFPWTLESRYFAMTKCGALDFFEWLNQNASYRVTQLRSLVAASGEGFSLDCSRESLLPLGQWLKHSLSLRKRTTEEMETILDNIPDWLKETTKKRDTDLDARSLSISFDLAIYFSQVLMDADNRIKWAMHTKGSKLDADLNQLVLTEPGKMRFNPIRTMKIFCFQVAAGKERPEALLELYDVWMKNLVHL